jgi:hypothetical protein
MEQERISMSKALTLIWPNCLLAVFLSTLSTTSLAAGKAMVFANYMPGLVGDVDYEQRMADANARTSKGVSDAPLYAQRFFEGRAPWGSSPEEYARYEISTAIGAGVDGFIFDYGAGLKNAGPGNAHVSLPAIDAFFAVAEKEFPNFRLALSLDEVGKGGDFDRRQATIQQFLQRHGGSPVLMRVEDRPVFFSYRANALDHLGPMARGRVDERAFVDQQMAVIENWKKLWRNLKINPVFIADLPNAWQWEKWGISDATMRIVVQRWAKAFDGISVFGVTDRLDQANRLYPIIGSICGSENKIFMSPVWWGYFAGKGRLLMHGSDMALGTWRLARQSQARWVSVNTWNDYSEQSNWAPSINHGYGLLDVLRAESAWFKAGSYALPATPEVVLFYRRTLAHPGMRALSGVSPWLPLDDEVDAVTISPQAGELRVGGAAAVRIGAGVESHRFPLHAGEVTATLTYGDKSVVARGLVGVTNDSSQGLWGTYIASSDFDAEVERQFGKQAGSAAARKDGISTWKSRWRKWIDPRSADEAVH